MRLAVACLQVFLLLRSSFLKLLMNHDLCRQSSVRRRRVRKSRNGTKLCACNRFALTASGFSAIAFAALCKLHAARVLCIAGCDMWALRVCLCIYVCVCVWMSVYKCVFFVSQRVLTTRASPAEALTLRKQWCRRLFISSAKVKGCESCCDDIYAYAPAVMISARGFHGPHV